MIDFFVIADDGAPEADYTDLDGTPEYESAENARNWRAQQERGGSAV